jgi:Cu/Ag efflux pump CusA
VDVRVNQPDDWPQFRITVDRSKAADLGLTEQNVANSVLLSLSGSSAGDAGLLAQSRRGHCNIPSMCARRNTRWIPCSN